MNLSKSNSSTNTNQTSNKNNDTSNGNTSNFINEILAPFSSQLNFDEEIQPVTQPSIHLRQPISTKAAAAVPSGISAVPTASSQANQSNNNTECVDTQYGNDLQSFLSLHGETLYRQHAIINSISEAQNGLQLGIEQNQKVATKSGGVIRASKAQQDRVRSASFNDEGQTPHHSF